MNPIFASPMLRRTLSTLNLMQMYMLMWEVLFANCLSNCSKPAQVYTRHRSISYSATTFMATTQPSSYEVRVYHPLILLNGFLQSWLVSRFPCHFQVIPLTSLSRIF